MSSDFSIEKFPKLNLSYYQCGLTKLNNEWTYKDQLLNHSICYYCLDGRFKLSAAGEEIVVTPGMLVVIPAGMPFDLGFQFSDAATQYWLHFDLTIDNESVFKNFSKPIVIPDPPTKAKSCFEKIVSCSSNKNSVSYCLLKSNCYALMAQIFEKVGFDISLGFKDSDYSLSKIVEYINEHYTESLSIDTLAKMCHFNTSYFIRIFKKKMGVTPHQYIQSLQIELARDYLKNTTLPIKNIASAVGFSGEKHFLKIFKACNNLSPAAFRQKYTNTIEYKP